MNPALKKLLAAIEAWPDEDQEALAEAAREIEALRTGVYVMSPSEEAAVSEGLLQVDRGDFADDQRIGDVWKRAGLCLFASRDALKRTSFKSSTTWRPFRRGAGNVAEEALDRVTRF
jgi:hypothetical protein